MKQKILNVVVGLFLSNIMFLGSAHAKTEIVCNMTKKASFNISIETQENIPTNGFENKAYDSVVTLSGPRLYQVTNEKLIVDYIHTRTDVGISYFVDLNNGDSITIDDIWFNSNPGKTHFDGIYLNNGISILLNCNYKSQALAYAEKSCLKYQQQLCGNRCISARAICNE